MSQKGFIQVPLLILVIGGLLFIAQPTQAGFFDWFSWSKIKSVFNQEKIKDNLPASVSEPIGEILLPQEESQKTSEENQTELQECPACERSQCPICPKPQICEPIIKEVPVEKIVYLDKIIYQQSDLDCRIEFANYKKMVEGEFVLYSQALQALTSCKATTTDFIASYSGLLSEFEETVDLILGLNRDYLFQSSLTSKIFELKDFASTSRAFIGKFK